MAKILLYLDIRPGAKAQNLGFTWVPQYAKHVYKARPLTLDEFEASFNEISRKLTRRERTALVQIIDDEEFVAAETPVPEALPEPEEQAEVDPVEEAPAYEPIKKKPGRPRKES